MKQLSIFVTVIIAAMFIAWSKATPVRTNTINPIVGDAGYNKLYGKTNVGAAPEDVRIQAHLAYVEQLLRAKDVSNMPASLQKRRAHVLNLLHAYWSAGVFPRNFDHPGKRVPCFIDKDGRICAVGYLVEQTAGRKAAEKVNAHHKYDEIMAMHDELVDNWIAASGLTMEEVAMIQPNYGYYPRTVPMSQGYAIASGLAIGANVGLSAINSVNMLKGTPGKTTGYVGLIAGAGTAFMGVFDLVDNDNLGYYSGAASQQNLSIANIGIGTASAILSAWNLFGKHSATNKATSWNIYGYPTMTGQTGVAMSLTRKL